ncbi:MAG: peptide chain release factor N(5)-glutamine methyltransferase [Candidatus Acidiferrales bacterium]|jgi:release factor glutamine methyltransferase
MNPISNVRVVRALLKQGLAQLREARVPSYTLAAELLLMHALGRDRAWLYAHPDEAVSEEAERRFFALLARRAAGEPTQHLTGTQEFWGLELEVTPAVLIPRPETEHVVEVALDRLALREVRAGRPQKIDGDGLRIADVGTGSGCIAIALAKEFPRARIHATDVSRAALDIARRNAARHGVADQILFIECNLLDGLSGSPLVLDLVVSNPPYVGLCERDALPREVREHEPEVALFAGEGGGELYPALIAQAAERLKPQGILVLELGHAGLDSVRPLLETPEWTSVGVTNDLAGILRVIAAERL